jgi:peptidoglycan/xylan/chitin deacetylase (PgdA/CDA1 family)
MKRRHHKNSQLPLIGVLLVVLAVLIAVAVTLSINLNIQINGGDAPLVLVYGKDTYVEPGAIATADDKTIEVEISGSVDVTHVGTYEITYKAQYLWITKKVTREVRVVDTTAPVITLKTVPGYFPLPGEEYVEEGYTATDDYDGDITDRVVRRVENETVYYTVKDSSGNETTVERPIIHGDITPPVLTLKGDKNITINAGSAYAEPGYTATDNIDGDITNKVQISGSVNIYHAGTYKLTYTVTDNHGNTATAERVVEVKPIKQSGTQVADGKVIYLTFDDGPGKHTQRLLDILAQYNAKATFFVVNTGYSMNKMLNAIVDGGHCIAIHSKTHDYATIYSSEKAFFDDLYAMQKIIKDATGVTTTIMRFPGGSSNTISRKYCEGIMTQLTQAVKDQGFRYFDWNVSSGDAGGTKDTAQVVSNVIEGIKALGGKKPAVVLQHDIHGFSVDAVEQILIWGIQNGYRFEALTAASPRCEHQVQN